MDVANKKLTIVFVTNNYTPYRGGVVSSIKAYARALRNKGHRVFVVSLNFRGVRPERDVIRVPCPIRFVYKHNQMAIPWRAASALERFLLQTVPDVVHIHHPFLLGYAALAVCKRLQIPTIFTHHTHYEQYLHYVPLPTCIIRPAVQARLRAVYQQVALVVVPSRATQHQVQAYDGGAAIVTVPSPVQDHFVMKCFAYKQAHERFRLLYVGRFTSEKNIPLLIELMTLLDVHYYNLDLVGYGYLEAQLTHLAYEVLNVTRQQVRFIHRPGPRRLCRLYRESDLFVFSSTTETQGLVLAEAMAAGTPVVALKGPGQNELVIDNVNGFLADNREHMAMHIQRIAHDRILFERLQYGAWQTSRQFYADRLADKLLQVYRSAISDF